MTLGSIQHSKLCLSFNISDALPTYSYGKFCVERTVLRLEVDTQACSMSGYGDIETFIIRS